MAYASIITHTQRLLLYMYDTNKSLDSEDK